MLTCGRSWHKVKGYNANWNHRKSTTGLLHTRSGQHFTIKGKTYHFIWHRLEIAFLCPLLRLPFWSCSHGRISHLKKIGRHRYCKTMHAITVFRKYRWISGKSVGTKKIWGDKQGYGGKHIVNITKTMIRVYWLLHMWWLTMNLWQRIIYGTHSLKWYKHTQFLCGQE